VNSTVETSYPETLPDEFFESEKKKEVKLFLTEMEWKERELKWNMKNIRKDSHKESIDDKENIVCNFYEKIGCCRFGDKCFKKHQKPKLSDTLIMNNMLDRNEDYLDQEYFKHIFEDVLSVFKEFGDIKYLAICCNDVPHLKGTIYIQYRKEEEGLKALQGITGRYYAYKQLVPEFCPKLNWNKAVCASFVKGNCNNKWCNYLHLFQNPNRLYDINNKENSKKSKSPNRLSRHSNNKQVREKRKRSTSTHHHSSSHSRRKRKRSRSSHHRSSSHSRRKRKRNN